MWDIVNIQTMGYYIPGIMSIRQLKPWQLPSAPSPLPFLYGTNFPLIFQGCEIPLLSWYLLVSVFFLKPAPPKKQKTKQNNNNTQQQTTCLFLCFQATVLPQFHTIFQHFGYFTLFFNERLLTPLIFIRLLCPIKVPPLTLLKFLSILQWCHFSMSPSITWSRIFSSQGFIPKPIL